MDLPTKSISLFSGGAGLDLGIELACPGVRTVCYVEREAYACATLVARMGEGSLAQAPIWSDVSTFDGRPWRGIADLISGGFPCQDVSNAGKRAGLDGRRSGLWFEYARIISEVRPQFVFIENVGALISRGLDRVLDSLASIGFDAEWGCFRASDVGAPHKRERVFILAYANGDNLRGESGRGCGESGSDSPVANNAGEVLGDATRVNDQRLRVGYESGDPRSTKASLRLGDPNVEGLEGRRESKHARPNEIATWPPGPEERDRWVEFLRMSPNTQPSICGGPHGLAGGLEHRIDRLRLLGNGVVPQVAAFAFRELARRIP